MSRRRCDPPEDPPAEDEAEDDEEAESDPDPEVEYFVDVEELDSVRTSVPNPLQSSQTSISAPSILTVVREDCSEPHISH
jgi:hypothetical protein